MENHFQDSNSTRLQHPWGHDRESCLARMNPLSCQNDCYRESYLLPEWLLWCGALHSTSLAGLINFGSEETTTPCSRSTRVSAPARGAREQLARAPLAATSCARRPDGRRRYRASTTAGRQPSGLPSGVLSSSGLSVSGFIPLALVCCIFR